MKTRSISWNLWIIFLLQKGNIKGVQGLVPEIDYHGYDAVQDQPYISVLNPPEFQSGPKVVKIVFLGFFLD